MSPPPAHWRWCQRYGLVTSVLVALWAVSTPQVADAQTSRRRRTVEAFTMKIGGTLGLTGNYKVESTHAFRGLKLLEEYANNNSLFKTTSGETITMHLHIENDQSSLVEVKRHYSRMIASGEYHAFVGPYSSGLSINASEYTNKSQSVMMLHQASSPSVYDQGFENLFSVNVMAGDYFAGGLELLRQLGAKTVVFAQGSSLFHKALCEGAIKHATRLGFEVLNVTSITGSDITAGIRTSLKFSPDVFVGCGHLYNAIQIAVTSRALMFNPKAMLLAQATSEGFIEAVRAPNANYVMGPVTWDKGLRNCPDCIIFTSPMAFADMYKKRWGVDPTYHSAQAVAAGIALMQAAVDSQTSSPTPQDLREALLKLEVNTIFGFLNFSKNGTRVGGSGLTQQLWPINSNASREERYRTLDIVLLDEDNPPKYPMPSWEQRELEIYPCDFGYVLNRSNQEDAALCQICEKGKYRNKASLICRSCPAGKYGLEPGLEECRTCEEGMDCSLTQADSQLTAAKGYFLVETRDEPLFVKCDPSFVCLEANKCVSHYVGVLCSRCQEGYTDQGILSQRNGVCFACTSGLWNLFGFCLLFAVYQAAYRLILYSQSSSAVSLTALHTVILRVIFNYAQFASTTVVATGFADYTGRTFRLMVSTFLDPLKHFMSLECMLQGSPWESYEVVVLLGLFLIPLSLLCCFVAIIAGVFLQLTQSRLTRHLLIVTDAESEGDRSSAVGAAASEAAVTESKTSISWSASVARVAASVTSSTELQRVPPLPEDKTEEDQHGETVMLDAWEHVAGNSVHFRRMQWEMILEFVRGKFTRCAVVWIFVLYPLVVRMLLVGSTCVEKDVLRLAGNLDVICHSASHLQWFRLSVFGLMMYGVGLPSLLFFQIFRVRQDLLNIEIRRNYGFLYNGFKREYFFFEIIFMARKLLVLCAASIPDMNVRMVCMLCCGFAFMGIHIRYVPYDNRDFFVLDRLETTNLIALLAPCTARLFFDIRARLVTSAFKDFLDSSIIDAFVLVFCLGAHVSFLVVAVWALVRNTFMKHLQLLEECFEERLNTAQRMLLKLTERQWHHVKMDPDTHELDISELSSRERHFLHQALCDTMKCYMAADVKAAPSDLEHKHQFYVGFMIAALRRAYKRVETARLRRAQNFLQLLDEEVDAGSHSRSFGTWIRGLLASDDPAGHRSSMGEKDWGSEQKEHGPQGPVIMRARRLILEKGITVEELHLALMLSWPDIAKGKEEYFILETKEDRERAFRREVQSAEGTTWNEQSVGRLFHEINLRRQMNAARNAQQSIYYSSEGGFSDVVQESSDLDGMLGLERAGEERAGRQALRRHHGDLLVDVMELRAQVRSLQRRMRAAREVGVDASLLTASLRHPAEGRRSSVAGSAAGGGQPLESPRPDAGAGATGTSGAEALLRADPPRPNAGAGATGTSDVEALLRASGAGEVVVPIIPVGLVDPAELERNRSKQPPRGRPEERPEERPESAAKEEEPLGLDVLLG